MHFITGGRATPRDEIENDVLPAFLGYYERGAGYGFWAAIEKSTRGFLGWFHFRPADGAPDEAELGYRLRRAAWGKGYATEGSRALIRKGFAELGVGGSWRTRWSSTSHPAASWKRRACAGADVPPGVARPHPRG